MKSNLVLDKSYKDWLADIKVRVRNVQIKAAVSVNTELLKLYWSIGAEVVAKQKKAKWGDGLIDQLSKDLSREFPDMKGFSRSNLMYIKKWYLFFSKSDQIVQQPVGQFTQIPWGHNIVIITKCKDIKEALFYVQKTAVHNWSRSVLVHQMDSGLYNREGKAISNFVLTLPKPQSDLAHETLKDPYVFDFLSMADDYNERDLENGLVDHLTKFLLELGAGFAFIGKQFHIQVGSQEFYIDLIFYHEPIGVSEYQLIHSLPKNLKSSLPTIEAIEKELSKIKGGPVDEFNMKRS